MGIERFIRDQFRETQEIIEKKKDDVEGRRLAVNVLGKLVKEIANWLNFDENVEICDILFVECQKKSEEKHNLSLAH